MSWQDRIGPAALTAPDGTRLEFIYEDVSKETDRHTAAFEFPDADGTFVQSLGRSGRRLPLRLFFSGDDYDLQADVFDGMLDQDGIFILEHPKYGTFKVVPFGKVTRRDELKTRGNQAIFDVTFFETNDLLFPISSQSPEAALREAIDAYLVASAEEFEETINQISTIEKVSLRDRYESIKGQAIQGLKAITAVTEEVELAFDTVNQAIDDAIETFISDPLALAFQTGILLQLPARAVALVRDRLNAYGNLLGDIVGTIYAPSNDSQSANSFRSDDMMASNSVMGAAATVLNNEFETKGDALAAADLLLEFFDTFTDWRDQNLDALGLIDTGGTYQKVLDGISTAAGFLVEISFSLKQERSITLVTAATPIELEARFYGTVDENLDFLINSNSFVGTEILEVPIGRQVVYYT